MGWRTDDELQQMLRESALGYLGEAGGPQHFRAVRESDGGFDAAAWARMAELGWTGILLPESVGGSALGLEPALTIAEELGRSVSPEPFVAAAVIAATLLAASRAPAAAGIAAELVSGARSATLAWQEKSGQIGRPAFETRLVGGRLTGEKLHVPAWHDGAALLVAGQAEGGQAEGGQADGGPVVVLVDPAAPGVTAVRRRMSDGSFGAALSFAGVAIAEADVILSGEEAAAALDLALARGTIALSAQLDGLASALWQRTADYMQQRVQFDQPLSDYQALRHRMVDLYAQIELAAASWRGAAASLANGEANGLAFHAAKARCSDTAMAMSRWGIQYHGAIGYTDDADVGLYVHAALTWSSWLGNGMAHRRRALTAREQARQHHG